MNHREYLKEMINEAPIAYDDETSAKIGKMHVPSKTKWGSTPPEDASVREVEDWVSEKVKMRILLGHDLGQGSSRIAKSNDGKTIFKYNYGSQPWGNQTAIEVKAYEKYKDEYGDILAKILKSGDNWYVQENVPEFNGDGNKFKKATGCSYDVWRTFVRRNSELPRLKQVNNYLKTGKQKFDFPFDEDDIENYDFVKQSDTLTKIIDFCVKSKVDIGDLISNNLGIKGNKLILIDYGFTTKMGSH